MLNKKGFTLVEVVVSMAILTIVAVMLSTIFVTSQGIQLRSVLQRQDIAEVSKDLQTNTSTSGNEVTTGNVKINTVDVPYKCEKNPDTGVKLCILKP